MSFKEEYQKKLKTADEAVKVVKSGDWLEYGWCVTTPAALDKALAKRMPELENINIRGGIVMWPLEITKIDSPADHFTWNSWHMGGLERNGSRKAFPTTHRSVIPSCRDITAITSITWMLR